MRNAKLLAACTAALGLVVLTTNGVHAAQGGSKLGQRDEELLLQAQQAGKNRLVLLIAATKGAMTQAVADVTRLGGQIQFRDDTLGYLRVSVATSQVQAVAALASVQSVDVDELVPLPDPRPDPEGIAPIVNQVAPSAATPRDNAYLPIGETGAAQFTAAHPTWDGRGVTIGVVDLGITLDHPSLLTTSTGARKIVDWVTGTDPFTDDDPTWLDMSAQVSGPQFTFSGRAYTAPGKGPYRIALFNERDPRLGGEVGSDVNRDGNPSGSSGIFAVLWDAGAKNLVWVDTNQNGSFACTSGSCALAGQSADGDSEESVTINNLAAGAWVVLVDGFAVPAGSTTFKYVDVFVNAAFGAVSITDANALRPAASAWTVPGTVTANAAPAAGRVLLGNVRVVTDTNLQVGTGDVIVENVQ